MEGVDNNAQLFTHSAKFQSKQDVTQLQMLVTVQYCSDWQTCQKKKIPYSSWVSRIKLRSKNHTTAEFYTINRLEISAFETSAIFYYNNKVQSEI
jgi:hypothetical protein